MVNFDKDLLFLYSENARTKIRDLSKLLSRSPQGLKYSLKVMEKEELLGETYTIFDYSYFGQILFRVYFHEGYLSEKDKDEILLYILERLLILSHPFTPFVTELIWRQFASGTLLMVDKWPKTSKFDDQIIADFSELKELVVAIRNIKAANKIAPTEFPDCYIVSKFLNQEYLSLAAKMSRVNLIKLKLPVEPIVINSSQVYINLKRELTDKERQSLEQYIKNTEAKLANQDFMRHAPPKVIADLQKKLAEAKQKLI